MKKYISSFIVVSLMIVLAYGVYAQLNKPSVPGKTKRIPCLAKVTSFERSYGLDDIKKMQELLKSGNYTISSDIDKAVHMDSTLFDYVDMKQMDSFVKELLETKIVLKKDHKIKAKVRYTIYENDKKDPKKKSDNCKLFRGYVVFEVLNEKNKIVYKSQIDFMDPKGADIKQTLKCSVESFITYN